MVEEERPYHHGNVRAAMVEAAVAAIAEGGTAAVSMRELARRVGVTHGAAAHHFGDKTGLLTAVAAQGFRLLAGMLTDAWAPRRSFRDVGVAYVRFAVAYPAHFELMFRPDSYRADDPELCAAKAASGAVLYGSAAEVADATGGDPVRAGTAGWAYVHGIATLWRNGNLPPGVGDDPVALAEEIGPYLFQASAAAARETGSAEAGSGADGSAGDGSARAGSAGDGSAGDGSAGDGSAGDGSAGDGSAGDGPTGDGSAGAGPTGDGSAGDGSAGDGSARG